MIMVNERDSKLSVRDFSMLDRAWEIARASTERHKHGAIIYKSGRVLAVGINTKRNQHPTMEMDYADYTRHAEINAMRAAMYSNLQGATVYIVRANVKTYSFMNSRPCLDCEQALLVNGVKRVVHS